jgi:hypothetical protein
MHQLSYSKIEFIGLVLMVLFLACLAGYGQYLNFFFMKFLEGLHAIKG